MLLPIGTDRPQEKIPWMNFLLIAANIAVYIFSHHAPAGYAGLDNKWALLILDPNNLWLFQFVTYQFLHVDLGHIFGNMIFLLVFGNSVNDKLGHAGYLLFYIAGGVLAGCGQVISNSGPTLGASGAVSAVTGIFFVLLLRTNIRLFVFVIPFYVESMYVILFSFFRDLLEQAMGMGQVAYMAHITGTICGFLIGLLLLLLGLVQRDQYDLLTFIERWKRRRQYEAIVAGQAGRMPKPGAALLDIAHQLAADNHFEEAALAYEDYLGRYAGTPDIEEVYYILGMIYAHAVPQRQKAIELLQKAVPLLVEPQQKESARQTLWQLQNG